MVDIDEVIYKAVDRLEEGNWSDSSDGVRLRLDLNFSHDTWEEVGEDFSAILKRNLIVDLFHLVDFGDTEHKSDNFLRTLDGEAKTGKYLTDFRINGMSLQRSKSEKSVDNLIYLVLYTEFE